MIGIQRDVPRVRHAVVAPALVRPVHPVALPRPVQAHGRRHFHIALAGVEVDLARRGLTAAVVRIALRTAHK